MVKAKEAKLADMIGNDKADEAADLGVKLFGEATVRTAARLANRHAKYTEFLKVLLDDFITIYKAKRTLMENIGKEYSICEKQPTTRAGGEQPSRSYSAGMIKVCMQAEPPDRAQQRVGAVIPFDQFSKQCNKYFSPMSLQRFLTEASFIPVWGRGTWHDLA